MFPVFPRIQSDSFRIHPVRFSSVGLSVPIRRDRFPNTFWWWRLKTTCSHWWWFRWDRRGPMWRTIICNVWGGILQQAYTRPLAPWISHTHVTHTHISIVSWYWDMKEKFGFGIWAERIEEEHSSINSWRGEERQRQKAKDGLIASILCCSKQQHMPEQQLLREKMWWLLYQ